MTREIIINELNNRGYKAEAQNTIKNGVELEGIRILTSGNIAPVIYTEEIIRNAEEENKGLDEVVSAIIGTYESHKAFSFDVDSLFDRNFVLNGLYIGLQKVSTEEIEKRFCDFEGIESYLYIRGKADREGSYSIKVTKAILESANISEVEAWEQAEANTNAETSLESLAKVMSEMMGCEYSEEMDEETPFFVITNKTRIKGASAILNKKVLAEFGERYHTEKIVVLPSSVHEMLLIPYTEEIDIDTFSEMVGEVNNTQVDPTERLTDRAYIITL
jgi:hypothetical protein